MAETIEQDKSPFANLEFSEEELAKTSPIEDFLSGVVTSKPEDLEKIEEEEEEKPKKKVEKKPDPKKEVEDIKKKTQEELDKVFNESEEEEETEEEEEPKKKVVKSSKKEEEPEEEESTDPNNTFSVISKTLFDVGLFSKDEGEGDIDIDSPEKLLSRFHHEAEKKSNEKIDALLGRFGDDYKNAFYAIYVDGVDPKEYFTTYNEIVDLAELDLKVESNQELIVKQELQERGFNPEQIKVKLEKIKNYGDLEEEATTAHSILLKNQTTKLAQKEQASKAALAQQTAIKQQFANNVVKTLEDKLKTKEFDGIPLNPKLAQELQDYLLVDKWKTSTGETLSDFDRAILELKKPENHTLKVKVALLLKTLEKDPTLQTIQKAGVTRETNSLFQGLNLKKDKSSVKGQKTTNSFASL